MRSRVLTRSAALISIVLALVVPFVVTGTGTATAQTAPPLELRAAGPIYAEAGGTIVYELTVKNVTGRTVNDVEFFNDMPNDTTFESGGVFVGDNGPPYTQFTLASIVPNATQKVRWTARVDAGLAVDTIITNTSFGFIDGAQGDAFGDVLTKIEAPATVESIFKNDDGTAFDVAEHGYGFENYGGGPLDASDDLTAVDMFALFGDAACKSGNTADTCVLTAAATKWRDTQLASMTGGHCEGMAATSLRLFEELPYLGLPGTPDRFQSGAARAFDLSVPNNNVENYIAHYFVTQSVGDYYYDESREIVKSPNELISILNASWNSADPTPYTVGIFRIDAAGEFEGGHAIVAYAVEKVDDDESRIIVYDNNFPGLRQYITVNTNANTWRYETAATPGEAGAVYTGNATSGNLSIHDNSSRDLPAGTFYDCEFCDDGSGGAALAAIGATRAALPSSDLLFEYSGEGALVVIDEDDNRSGGDFESDAFLREIPGTSVEHHKGGLGLDIPASIRVPRPADGLVDYSVIVHGRNTDAATSGDLSITGPGFVIGVNDIDLSADEIFEFVVDHEGESMAFAASEAVEAPEVFISYDPVSDEDPSVIFDIEGVELLAGEEAQIELEPDLERVFFSHSGPEAEEFVIDMQLIWPDGDVQDFAEAITTPAGTNEAFVDFGSWDGLGHPPIYIDGELTNPSVEHRLALVGTDTTFRPDAGEGAASGVYDITATFQNVTEVSLEDLSFVLDELDDEDTLQNADGSALVPVPDEALGDSLIDPNETFEFTFSIGLGDAAFGGAVFGAEGVPFDWSLPDVAPSYEANDGPFVFAAAQTRGITPTSTSAPEQVTTSTTPAALAQRASSRAVPSAPSGPLAATGAQTDLLVPIAAMLVLLGASFVLVGRRRQTLVGFTAPDALVERSAVRTATETAPTMFVAPAATPSRGPIATPVMTDESHDEAPTDVAPVTGAPATPSTAVVSRPDQRSVTTPVLAAVAVVTVVAVLRWRRR